MTYIFVIIPELFCSYPKKKKIILEHYICGTEFFWTYTLYKKNHIFVPFFSRYEDSILLVFMFYAFPFSMSNVIYITV